jgi:hypothetical protein
MQNMVRITQSLNFTISRHRYKGFKSHNPFKDFCSKLADYFADGRIRNPFLTHHDDDIDVNLGEVDLIDINRWDSFPDILQFEDSALVGDNLLNKWFTTETTHRGAIYPESNQQNINTFKSISNKISGEVVIMKEHHNSENEQEVDLSNVSIRKGSLIKVTNCIVGVSNLSEETVKILPGSFVTFERLSSSGLLIIFPCCDSNDHVQFKRKTADKNCFVVQTNPTPTEEILSTPP